MKILVATEKPFAAAAIQGIREIIEGAGYELALLEKYTEKQQLLDAVADADGLIIRSDIVDNEVLDAAKNLKIVVRAGAGYDNVDLTSATAHNVCVENTPGQNSNAVAELAFGMMVMAARNMYDGKSGFELKGKHLGIQAFGQVGRNVARIGQGFGMEVEAVDPYCPETAMIELNVKPVKTVAELYAGNQFVSINIPATPETIKSINYELITSMPKNGVSPTAPTSAMCPTYVPAMPTHSWRNSPAVYSSLPRRWAHRPPKPTQTQALQPHTRLLLSSATVSTNSASTDESSGR